MNYVNIKRINDNARRIYAVPEGTQINKGDLVLVETSYGGTLHGIAVDDSVELNETAIGFIRTALNLNPAGEFMKVIAVFGEPKLLELEDDDTQENG